MGRGDVDTAPAGGDEDEFARSADDADRDGLDTCGLGAAGAEAAAAEVEVVDKARQW